MKTKICTKCGKELPATKEFFPVKRTHSDGLHSWCRECGRKYARQYARENREAKLEYGRQWRKENREAIIKYALQYARENREAKLEYMRQYRKENPKYTRQYRQKNADKLNANTAKRRARKRNQTPDLTQDEKLRISEIYKKAHELGKDWQVDHIVPLSRGGLHHPDNLQIVLKSYNLQKHDRLEDEFRPPTKNEIYKT